MNKWIYSIITAFVVFSIVGDIYFYDVSVTVGAVFGVLVFIFIAISGTVKAKHLKSKNREG
ncbi:MULTISPECIES: hypothetical protein [unclassified Peribacillus]|uniref:hypothetical protein n=1 Tax=unclassified Peribacillus TaxID=2675266 RepID=UPI00366EA17C